MQLQGRGITHGVIVLFEYQQLIIDRESRIIQAQMPVIAETDTAAKTEG